jgi:hypothetical protein
MIGVLSRQGFAGKHLVFKRENFKAVGRLFFESLDDNDQSIVVEYSNDQLTWTTGTPVALKAYGKADAAPEAVGTYVRYSFQGDTLMSVVSAYDQTIDHVYGA